MIEIELTQNQITFVDDIDSDLAKLKWQALWNKSIQDFYVARIIGNKLNQETQYMHRVIMGRILNRELLQFEYTDHKNHNTLDNRRSNLRLANHGQNQHNRKKQSNNTSGYKGVTWHKHINKWYAQIVVNGKKIYLGYFDDPIDAAIAYDQAAKNYFGEFALLNFKD